jgi:hypothetical protein
MFASSINYTYSFVVLFHIISYYIIMLKQATLKCLRPERYNYLFTLAASYLYTVFY